MTTQYCELKLGYASAEEEGVSDPELLLQGYFDLNGLINEAKLGRKFLFLGYKGSGKSAISEHLRLSAIGDSQQFVTTTFLSDFPYTDFKNIIRGDAEAESKYPTAWSWLLLLNLFSSFAQDAGSPSISDIDFFSTLQTLENLGLIPSPSLRQMIITSSKRNLKLSIPSVLETSSERSSQEQGLQIPFFVERLKTLSAKFKSESMHYLVIDGLDDILTKRQIQYESLAALVFEVSRLNTMFRKNNTSAKIILLCRTDLFERLPGANKNKVRQDSSMALDWYHDPRNPGNSNLIKLINQKIQATHPEVIDIFSQFFPQKVKHIYPERVVQQDPRAFLLDLTRHTPRDFIQILSHIQTFSQGHKGILTKDQILNGVRSYSINYFLPEIKDEMVGYIPVEAVESAISLIGSLRKREFTLSELSDMASKQERYSQLKLHDIISALFECSAIGNLHNRPRGQTYYTFKYRNRNSTLNLEDTLILHRGVWKALNLI